MSPPTNNTEDQVHLSTQEKLDQLDQFLQEIEQHRSIINTESDPYLRSHFISELDEIQKSVLALREKVQQSRRNLFKKTPASAEVVGFESDINTLMVNYEQQSSKIKKIVEENRRRLENLRATQRIQSLAPESTSRLGVNGTTMAESPQETSQPVSTDGPTGNHLTQPTPTLRTNVDNTEHPAALSGEEPPQFERGWAAFPVYRSHLPEMARGPRDLEEEERRSHQREVSIVTLHSLPPPPRRRPHQPFVDLEARVDNTAIQEEQRPAQRNPRPFSSTFGPQPDLGDSSSVPMEDSGGQEPTTFMDEGNNFSDDDDMYV